MSAFKENCIALRKRGHTLGEIVRITGRPKTSVYVHIRNMPLGPAAWHRIRAEHGARIRKFAIARKGRSERQYRTFEWNKDTVLLVSHLIFDGEIRQSGCMYNNRNDALLNRVETLMKTIYDFEPRRYPNSATGVTRISYFNVALSGYVLTRARELFKKILRMSNDLKIEFLRAFFDDEGCMDFRPSRNLRQIRGYQKNLEILRIVQSLLRDFEITSGVVSPNEIKIVGKENLLKFQREINFSPGVRINGKRSNSIWGKSLEKRELLRRAIVSYKPVGSNGVHRSKTKLVR